MVARARLPRLQSPRVQAHSRGCVIVVFPAAESAPPIRKDHVSKRQVTSISISTADRPRVLSTEHRFDSAVESRKVDWCRCLSWMVLLGGSGTNKISAPGARTAGQALR